MILYYRRECAHIIIIFITASLHNIMYIVGTIYSMCIF